MIPEGNPLDSLLKTDLALRGNQLINELMKIALLYLRGGRHGVDSRDQRRTLVDPRNDK